MTTVLHSSTPHGTHAPCAPVSRWRGAQQVVAVQQHQPVSCRFGWDTASRDVRAYGRRAAKNALRKGKADAIKTKLNSRFGKLVLQAAKQGGTNPEVNVTLQQVMEQARKANVPKDIIERNLKRAEDKDAAALNDEVVEVYGPGGTGFIMECLTDNRTRATTEIWTIVKKLGGKMAESGSVAFNFNRCGEVAVTGISEDAAFEAAMDGGADDVMPLDGTEDGQECYKIVTQAGDYGTVRDAIAGMGIHIDEERSGLTYQPMALVELEDDEQFTANEALYDRCLDLDDVDAIFSTCADVGRNKP